MKQYMKTKRDLIAGNLNSDDGNLKHYFCAGILLLLTLERGVGSGKEQKSS